MVTTAPWVAGCGGAGEAESGAADPHGPVPAGNVSDLATGVPRVLDQSVVVYRDALGVYAMSTICTHNRCDISKGGVIDAAGEMIVQADVKVSADQRTPIA
jgi:hypothetical protein